MKKYEGTYYSPMYGFCAKRVTAKTKAAAKKLLGSKDGYRLVNVYEI